jgi:hypothetical protein
VVTYLLLPKYDDHIGGYSEADLQGSVTSSAALLLSELVKRELDVMLKCRLYSAPSAHTQI